MVAVSSETGAIFETPGVKNKRKMDESPPLKTPSQKKKGDKEVKGGKKL